MQPLLQVRNIEASFDIYPKYRCFLQKPTELKAINDISFDLNMGETLGIVGESGCGKSTLAKVIAGLIRPKSGYILFNGKELIDARQKALGSQHTDIQMVFQNPIASLNPRMTIGDIIAEPLFVCHPHSNKYNILKQVYIMMEKVYLSPQKIAQYPHELSGGECQRVSIARALIAKPKLVICDEPTSSLDIPIQTQIISLFQDLQKEMGMALIFIAHDLSVIRHISDHIMVMYLGNILELGTNKAIYTKPIHPYTQALLNTMPSLDSITNNHIKLLVGDLPSPINPPSGCVFHTRCPLMDKACCHNKPTLQGNHIHKVACFKKATIA